MLAYSYSRFIPSGAIRAKPNAKYSTHFLPPSATKGKQKQRKQQKQP